MRVPPPPVATWRPATVVASNHTTKTCTVLLNGSSNPIPDVPFPTHYQPTIGDRCQVVINAVGGVGPADISVVCKYEITGL